MDGIVVALIGAGASIIVEIIVFIGVVFTNKKSNEKIRGFFCADLRLFYSIIHNFHMNVKGIVI